MLLTPLTATRRPTMSETKELESELKFPVRDKLKFLFDLDSKWFLPSRTAQDDSRLGYIPYQLADFIGMMSEITRETSGDQFLDVGSGPGVKMSIAHQLFGYDVTGIEINFDMCVDAARANAADTKADIWCDDALETPDGFYAVFDVIWLNRQFRDPELEQALEDRILEEAKPGAILASGYWLTDMPSIGWLPVVDDFDLRAGAWFKPALS
jgi:hypothetical protein